MNTLMRRLLNPLLVVLAVIVLIEEWLWDHLKKWLQTTIRALHLQRVTAWLENLPPWASLLALVLPGFALFPFKMLALYAIGHGAPFLGVLAFVGAKLVGTALFAYVFELVKSNARQMAWFDRVYVWVTSKLQGLHAWFNEQPAVKRVRALKASIKASMKTRVDAFIQEQMVRSEDSANGRWLRKWRAARLWARRY